MGRAAGGVHLGDDAGLSVWMFVDGRWWFPPSISEHGPAYDQQFILTIIVVGVAFVAAQVALGYAVWRFRDTGDGSGARRLLARQQPAGDSSGRSSPPSSSSRVGAPRPARLGQPALRRRRPAGARAGAGRRAAVPVELPLPRRGRQVRPHRPDADQRRVDSTTSASTAKTRPRQTTRSSRRSSRRSTGPSN